MIYLYREGFGITVNSLIAAIPVNLGSDMRITSK
jgi:hypothetical protein